MSQRILVIDDEQTIRTLISEILHFAGYDVFTAAGGEEGLSMLDSIMPDLILCDVSMPDLDGYECLAAVRQNEDIALTPFIFLTGKGEHDDIRRGMDSGADDYLVKPFDARDLLRAVQVRLERQAEVARLAERKLDDLRGNIVHMLPHELRTPLQGIIGFADMLRDESASMDRVQVGEMADHILSSAQRLHRVVENFLLYAQIQVMLKDEQALSQARTQSATLDQSYIESIAASNPIWDSRTHDLNISMARATIACSQDDLRKIIIELIDNAVKFSTLGSPITITGEVTGSTYHLTIVDCGRGMTPEQIKSIGAYQQFERSFYEQQGTGLGLTIAKGLADINDAMLAIVSETDGEAYTTVGLDFKLRA